MASSLQTSGVKGAYQLLLFMQFVEFLSVVALVGMLGLKIIFFVKMIFGNSDWAGNLRWNIGNTTSSSYFLLLTIAYTSLCFMLWLVATPLKSASTRSDAHAWNWDSPKAIPEPSFERKIRHSGGGKMREKEIF